MFGPNPLVDVTRFEVNSFSFAPSDAFNDTQPPTYEVTVSFGMQRPDGDAARNDEFRLLVELRFGPGTEGQTNAVYEVQLRFVTYFRTPVPLGDDRTKVPTRVLNNALMIAYGIARGIVGQATAASERGQFVLPAMTFDSLITKSNASFDDQALQTREATE